MNPRPDAVLFRRGKALVVVDAKYKLTSERADVYQMIAYCHGLGLHNAVLAHPETEGDGARTLTIRGIGNFRVHYMPLALTGTPIAMRATTEGLARALMALAAGNPGAVPREVAAA